MQSEINYKMKSQSVFPQIVLHSIFWAIVCYFFTRYSYLRPLAVTDMYKEYLTVLFIMTMVYINYLFLIPRYFLSGRFKTFFLLSTCVIVLTGIGEFFLVKSNIDQCTAAYITREERPYFYKIFIILLIIRDLCFLLFFFLMKLYRDLLAKYKFERQVIAEKSHTITVMESSKEARVIKIKDIVYLSYNQNYTKFHMLNGKVYSQYISLKNVESLLPQESYLRINKGNIVMLSHIADYNDSSVTLSIMEEGEQVVLQISPKEKDNILDRLKKSEKKFLKVSGHLDSITAKFDGVNSDEGVFLTVENSGEEILLDEKSLESAIFDFILTHPNCKMIDINEAIHDKSTSSIERGIRRLKAGRFIEYRGATKNGGYYVVETENEITD